jgi:hypothetical protein
MHRVDMLATLTGSPERPTSSREDSGGDEACARLLLVTNVVFLNPQVFLAHEVNGPLPARL